MFVNCRGRGGAALYFPELQMHMPYGVGGAYGSGPGYDILHGSNTGTYDVTSKPEVMVCKVSVDGSNRFKRINPESPGSNCTRSPGSNLSVNPYNERDGWIGEVSFGDTLQYMQNLNEPEHIRADGIATLYEGQELGRGDLLVSVDGRYSARLQYDGNFVVRDNAAGTVLWAATSCGLALGGYLYHKLVMQSDGNLVLYSSDNYSSWIPRWASANMNTCGGGSFGTGSAKRLELQTDGNLIVYMGSSVLWDRL